MTEDQKNFIDGWVNFVKNYPDSKIIIEWGMPKYQSDITESFKSVFIPKGRGDCWTESFDKACKKFQEEVKSDIENYIISNYKK